MLINLRSTALQPPQNLVIELNQRLPDPIKAPCTLNCRYAVSPYDNYYLLDLEVSGLLSISCQRCLEAFDYEYVNQTQVAVCHSESEADQLMSLYECIVAEIDIDLADILTDELHLYAPKQHEDIAFCNPEMIAQIGLKASLS